MATIRLSAVYAGVVADAAILAARDPGSRGEAYNITSQGPITQREFLDLFADALQVPRVKRHVPYRAGLRAADSCSSFGTGCSCASDLRGSPVTARGYWAGISSTAQRKLASRLGWQPAIGYAESIERTLRWFLNQEARAKPAAQKGTLERPGAFAGGAPGG